MSVGNIVKRVLCEILFLMLFFVLMPWHYFYALFLLTYEVFRIYPREIYELAIKIVYGTNGADE